MISYIAGLFDGEGCVRVYRNKEMRSRRKVRFGLVATIAITSNKAPLDICHKRWGGSIYWEKRPARGRRDMWRWKVHDLEAEKFLNAIKRYSLVKREQIDIALKFRKTFVPTSAGGSKVLTDEIFKLREKYYHDIAKAK